MILKKYLFSQTLPSIACIISKVRLMQKLTSAEEMRYLVEIKGMSEGEAYKILAAHYPGAK